MNNVKKMRRGIYYLGMFTPLLSPLVVSAAILDVGSAMTCGITQNNTIAIIGNFDLAHVKAFKTYQRPFSQISAGYTQICAIYDDKTQNEGGTLICGVNNKIIQRSGTFSQVSVGTFHTCGLHTDGSVECWKDEQKYLKGIVPDYGQTTPPDDHFSQVSVGRWHTCGIIKSNQTVSCWGNNRYNQTVSPPDEVFSQISAAKMGWHTCGIKVADQTVACWGLNDHGQATPPSASFSQVSAGKWYTCGIRANDQNIMCWGGNQDGQAEAPSGRFLYVSAGMNHTCALRAEDHAPVCWGYNMLGSVKNVSKDSLPLKTFD